MFFLLATPLQTNELEEFTKTQGKNHPCLSLGRPRQGLTGERSPPAQQVMHERSEAETTKGERQHGSQKDPFHYVRGCEKTEMNE
jgi:hypothetical protein